MNRSVFGKVLVRVAPIAMLLCTGCPPVSEVHTLVHDGLTRWYLLHLPPAYDGRKLLPLVVALHGAGGTPENMRDLTGFSSIADREGFEVVYPAGLFEQWNDGRGVSIGPTPITYIDDAGFISDLITVCINQYAADPARVYVVGESNGGMMAQRLACQFANRLAAVASVIGSLPVNDAQRYTPNAPVPMLMINSENDPIVPWNGGDVWVSFMDVGKVLSVQDSIDFWVRNNHCDPIPVSYQIPDPNISDGMRTWCDTYNYFYDRSTQVVLYRIQGAGHTWPDGLIPQTGAVERSFNASEVIWNFFKDKSR